jgi:hypothetical protein
MSKKLLDIRIEITHLNLDEDFYFNESSAQNILLTLDQALILTLGRGKNDRTLMTLWRRVNQPPLPSVLLANVQLLENKRNELQSRLFYQQDIKNFNILCFLESWMNKDMDNIQLAGVSMPWQDRTAASGKIRGGGTCFFVNKDWCAISNIKSRDSARLN